MTSASLRLGTRSSPLARWQAEWVAARLEENGVAVELIPISTQGDKQQQGPIAAMGGIGVFTKEIQRALLETRIDLAVHSLKDLPTERVAGLTLAAVPPRGPIGDVLVSREGHTFESLPTGAVVGTGSVRRQAQLWHARRDLQMRDVRGNVETRLRKLEERQYDALVLAEAGLVRLELSDVISERLPRSLILPAVGQGALGLETRDDDDPTRRALRALNDAETYAAVLAERALLARLRAGCLAPVGAWGRRDGDALRLDAVVLSPDGRQRLEASATGALEDGESLGRRVADDLLAQGAADLIKQTRVDEESAQ